MKAPSITYGRSSAGRAVVSKTKGRGFDPFRPCKVRTDNKMIDFIKGAYYEFTNHVTWPKWNVLQSSTVVVAVATLILAVFLYGVDSLFSEAINGLYTILK